MKKTTITQVFIGILISILFLKDVFGSISLKKNNCFIESYSKIYYQKYGHNKDWEKIIKKSTCPKKIDKRTYVGNGYMRGGHTPNDRSCTSLRVY